MVRVTEELALSPEHVTLYYASDPLLGHLPILIFHGPSTTANYTLNSSRIQVHIISPAGYLSFPRITVSPNSPFYSVVSYLPREFQGDEVCRGLAFGLYKYFTELPEAVKSHLKKIYPSDGSGHPASAPELFSEQHAANIAKDAVQADNTLEVIGVLEYALRTQHISHVDLDLVLPPGSIVPLNPEDLEEVPEDEDDILDPSLRQYCGYSPLVKLFGEPVFLPTSKLRRAPSRPISLNRTKSFSKNQKVDLRMKMSELVDTEERYVLKVNELVNTIANEFRKNAKNRPPNSISPTEEDLEKLFPKSADRILEVNTAFMQELRRVMDETEEEAIQDMENTGPGARPDSLCKTKDPTGVLAMAKVFLEWFPKFADCYQDYIRASQNFPQLLNLFLDKQSSFRQRVAHTGEQTIRSLLIEPVQRLPRYNLLIDQIISCLPITHPALQLLLKARDIITNICSMDEPLPDEPHVNNRLRAIIEGWPVDIEPQGRLVVAVDFLELSPPYVPVSQNSHHLSDRPGILLVFSDCVVLVQKKGNTGITGRDLLREVERPSAAGLLASMTNAASGQGNFEFMFIGWHNLADVRFTESSDGRLIWMTSTQEMKGGPSGEPPTGKAPTSRCFLLQDIYEGRANKFAEDIVKARICGRFSEKEREEPTWTLRSVKMLDNTFGLHAAVFQEGAQQLIEGRREPAAIRIVVDTDKGSKGAPVGHYGVEIVAEVRTGDLRRIQMNTMGLNGKRFVDDVALEDFLPTLARRIIQLLNTQCGVTNPTLVPALVSYYTKILRAITVTAKVEEEKSSRSFLSSSPVKLLSNFLGGNNSASSSTTTLDNMGINGSRHKRARSNSTRDVVVVSGPVRDRDILVPRVTFEEDEPPENPLVRLEQTFTGYVANMQARKGYFVARTLLNRNMADELAVNDLYNRLIEYPFDLEAASEVGTDVIFAAFEKFIRIAWREQIGPVITKEALDALQIRASKKVPGEFSDFVRFIFSDMAPQNRRAFTALVKLLADLLEGCSNDGDRGALTLAFAELLVEDGTAPNYINLLDLLVEDCERIFDYTDPTTLLLQTYEALMANQKGSKSATGSVSSNTSSLRRKFGWDSLLRQNSKGDSDRPSVWRTLSKHHKTSSADNSLSKGSRPKSIDLGPNFTLPNRLRRPNSRDRPPVVGAFDDIIHRPTSSYKLETIDEPDATPIFERRPLRRKRRSSLSDLRSLMENASLEDVPTLPLRLNRQRTPEKAARTPSPTKVTISPQAQVQIIRSSSSRQKENGDSQQETTDSSDTEQGSLSRTRAKTITISQIPTLKPVTRLPVPSSPESPTRPSSSTSKLSSGSQRVRLQTTQKLRERLQTEKKIVEEVDSSFKSELSRISEDMSRVSASIPRTPTVDLRKLQAAVQALEERVPQVLQELQERHADMQRDMEATLKATEAKVKAIDQLYKEATAENELLYEKFNSELSKIVKALKGKGREDKEELVQMVKEASDEAAKLKKENARLKREMASLRNLLKGATTGEGS